MSNTPAHLEQLRRRGATLPRGVRASAAGSPRGITLLEMILVIAILAMLVILTSVSYLSIRNTAYDRATEARLSQMAKVGMGDVIFGGNTGMGFAPDGSDFAAQNASASNLYKDMDFIPATESSDHPGEVSVAVGDSTLQQAAVAYANGDLAAFATRSRSGNCTFAVVNKMGATTTWTKATDECMASGALRPITAQIPDGDGGAGTPADNAGDAATPTPTSTTTTPAPTPTTTEPTTPATTTTTTTSAPTTTTPAPATTTPQVYMCGGKVATVVGTEGDDVLYGRGDDVIVGLGGNDTIYLSNQNDIACGGAGNDTIYGGNGKDLIYGDGDDDSLYGGNGNDTIYGGAGDDYIDGGNGPDTLIGGEGDDTLVAGHGGNTVVVQDGPNS